MQKGSSQIVAGSIMGFVSLMTLITAFQVEILDYRGSIDQTSADQRAFLLIAAGGFFAIALLLFGVGMIVRALSTKKAPD